MMRNIKSLQKDLNVVIHASFHILTRGRSDENIAMNSIVLSHICVFVSDFSNNKRIPIKKHFEVFQEVHYLTVFDCQI